MGLKRTLDSISHLVVHCSATPNGKAFTAADIDAWHKKRGFTRDMRIDLRYAPRLKHIGYHYVILVDGGVQPGRPLTETGAHCQQQAPSGKSYNTISIGVCLIGTDRYTRAQWDSLAEWCREARRQYPRIQMLGHRDTSPDRNRNGIIEPHEWVKLCPGFDVTSWIENGYRPTHPQILDPE